MGENEVNNQRIDSQGGEKLTVNYDKIAGIKQELCHILKQKSREKHV